MNSALVRAVSFCSSVVAKRLANEHDPRRTTTPRKDVPRRMRPDPYPLSNLTAAAVR